MRQSIVKVSARKYPRKVIIGRSMELGRKMQPKFNNAASSPQQISNAAGLYKSVQGLYNYQRPVTPESLGPPMNSLQNTPSNSQKSSFAVAAANYCSGSMHNES